jgi:superoxide oxidase
MQTDFSPDLLSEPPRAITLRYRGWSGRPAHGFPAAGLFGFRKTSALHSMGHAGMSASDSPNAYTRRPPFDNVTVCLHWATVLIVLALFTSAMLRLQLTQDDASKVILLQIHRSLGVTVWVVTALRLAWRQTNAKLPPFTANTTKMYRTIVPLSEYGLYVLLLGQPIMGLSATLFGGRPFPLFLWQIPQLISADETLRAAFHLAHEVGAWLLGALVAGHAATALIHHFVFRDDVLQCMAPAIPSATQRSINVLKGGSS